MSEHFKVVIPARYASSRLPGKPLVDIAGRPMIAWVHAAAIASGADEVVIATDDQRVADVCRAISADVAMTRPDHASGTDRVAEVAQLREWSQDSIVINIQGDEPLLPPELVQQVAALLSTTPVAEMATLVTPVESVEEWLDTNMVNVISDQSGRALYFSRAPIPWSRGDPTAQSGTPNAPPPHAQRHVGIYGYRVGALQRLAAAPTCNIEQIERLEQLRALWIGFTILTAQACQPPPRGVDTADDLEAVRRLVAS